MIRKLIQAVNGQARTIRSQGRRIRELESALRFVVTAAGLQQHPRVAALWKRSQDENPANAGWAVEEDVAAEAPETTSEEALGDVNNEAPEGGSGLDDVTAPGSTSETDVAADAQTDLSSTEVVLDTPAYSEDQDVTSPVAGTEDLGEGPAGEAGSGRTESEVVVGTPADDSPAFAIEEGGWETEARRGEARTLAALRLARLRLQAGIEGGDDLDIAGRINHSKMSDRDIQHEIDVLAKVVKAGSNGQARQVRTRVPRLSSRRVAPSMQEEPVIPIQTIAAGPSDDEFLWE